MRRPAPTLLSKLARLVPVLVLILAFVVAPAWGGTQTQDEPQTASSCCNHSASIDPSTNLPAEGDDDDGCCGDTCHGCICTCAKLILVSGLTLAPTSTAIAPAVPAVELSALSLSEADPIFHPPRA